ncbi:hypothetical protein E5K00_11555 [Hymenobacter aquaticus]|uniref:Uncharacterized protein n=1 Tax=Hymenobacter aquaticus TaxID=1867101 RepID=A0A4Z0QAR1_9BACT|nr:hypothetical protein [Hymenobacter aquaticus]TGE25792.1 hypothetical protein E5K00_11555 [Hymenobacter aquaticus]
MSQKEFTDYVTACLFSHFPQFVQGYAKKHDDIMVIDYPSSQGKLLLRITTRGRELAVGFAANAERFAWHLHMRQLGAITPEEEIQAATQLLRRIFTDSELIVHSSALGYFLTEDPAGIYQYQQPEEIISVFHWSEL